jgi:muramoyltetrapeptide carboxypeptidase
LTFGLMTPCQLPPPLQKGDLLKVIAPSGAMRELEACYKGIDIWRSRGYRVEVSPKIEQRWGYLAGTDEERRSQLKEAWLDPECRGILCARGGYGSARLLENWEWDRDVTPKWLIGFSDVTGLLWSLTHLGISGVHAPLLTTIATEPEWSRDRLFNWLENHTIEPISGKGWGNGRVTGILLPANLTVATHLLGTPIQSDLNGVILALEDVGEAPYRLDRMLTQWRLSGALSQVRGIAIGRFSQCEPPSGIPSYTVEQVLSDRLGDLSIPIVSHLPFGHDGCNAALPVGVMAELDGDKGILSVGN